MQNAAAVKPAVCIVDYGSGRLPGGHQEDYLAAMEAALDGRCVEVVAPFMSLRPSGARAAVYLGEWRLFRRLLSGAPQLAVCHTPEFRDLLLFASASLMVRRPTAIGVFVLRRNGVGIVGRAGPKARLLEFLVTWLIRTNRLYPVSDSRLALEHWLLRAPGASGSLVSIPIPIPPAEAAAASAAGPVIGLLGQFRLEKGARHYDAVTREALDLFPEARVRLNLAAGLGGEEGEIVSDLQRDWTDHPRVEIRLGPLGREEYAAQFATTDVVVLPYDLASYGSGTSGVLHDALALGRTVVATPIPWVRDQFFGHPRLVWLQGTGRQDMRQALRTAVERSKSNQAGMAIEDSFARDWDAALAAAWQRLQRRPRRGALDA